MASPALQLGPMMEVVKRFLDELTAGELAPVLAGLQLLEPVTLAACALALLAAAAALLRSLRAKRVYLLDFSVYKPPESWKVTRKEYDAIVAGTGDFEPDSLEFMSKVLARSGLGNETYAPPSLTNVPMDLSMTARRREFEAVAFGAVKDLLNKAGVPPRQVGIVITNSSLFNTTPSLSAAIMNHFKLPSRTVNYNLGGMGCSAGIIAADLARQLLLVYPNTYALIVSTENLTNNWYPGSNRGMLVTNTIFRVGGAAVLMTNKRSEARRSKYVLRHLVRTNLAADDAAFGCVFEVEDEQGVRGVRLGKELMGVAGVALKKNIMTLGPHVLPYWEQAMFAANLVARKVYGSKRVKTYVPSFTRAFEHVCIHTGGRAVVDEIEKQLALGRAVVEPSRASLFRFGNVSSSSIWYVLAYTETFRGVRKGDRVWQLGFGSGFKCNSAVWVAARSQRSAHAAWEGFDAAAMYEELAQM